jgi:hypothetical protein
MAVSECFNGLVPPIHPPTLSLSKSTREWMRGVGWPGVYAVNAARHTGLRAGRGRRPGAAARPRRDWRRAYDVCMAHAGQGPLWPVGPVGRPAERDRSDQYVGARFKHSGIYTDHHHSYLPPSIGILGVRSGRDMHVWQNGEIGFRTGFRAFERHPHPHTHTHTPPAAVSKRPIQSKSDAALLNEKHSTRTQTYRAPATAAPVAGRENK